MDESRIGQYSISVTTYPIMALEYVLVKKFCPNKSDDKFMNYRQQTTIFH